MIDASIPLQAKGATLPDIFGMIRDAQDQGQRQKLAEQQFANGQQQADIQGLQLKEAQGAQADKTFLESLYAKNTGTDGKVDEDKILSSLFQAGKPELAQKLTAQKAAADEVKRKMTVDDLKLATDRAKALGGLARGALEIGKETNPLIQQAQWKDVAEQALRIDPNLAQHIPESYDEGFLKQAIEHSRTEEESLAAHTLEKTQAADALFQKDKSAIQSQVNGIGTSQTKLNQLKLDLTSKYPDSKLAKDYAAAIDLPKPERRSPYAGKTFKGEGGLMYRFSEDGIAVPILDGDGNHLKADVVTKPPTQDQANTAIYGRRMQEAVNDMGTLSDKGYDRGTIGQGVESKLPNQLQSSELQRQSQAERNFVNATLRRESGAAISQSEFDSAEKQYFPRAGDSKEVKEQKKKNREIAIESFKGLSGPAWNLAGGDPKKGGEIKTYDSFDAAKDLPDGTKFIVNGKTYTKRGS